MKSLFFSVLADNIGLTLLYSLWSGLIGALAVLLLKILIKGKFSNLRYWLFFMVLIVVAAANFYKLDQLQYRADLVHSPTNLSYTELFNTPVEQPISSSIVGAAMNTMRQSLPFVVMFWWLGVVLLLLRLSYNIFAIRRLAMSEYRLLNEEIYRIFYELQEKLALNKFIRLIESRLVQVPIVLGHFKPIILLPIGLVNGLTAEQVEAVLLHELSHIKRNDFIINFFQSVIEVMYFFNPFIWMISSAIREEREHACDDMAISVGVDPKIYIRTLASIVYYKKGRQELALHFTSKNKFTLKRIQRIMKTQSNNNSKLWSALILVLTATLFMELGAQSNAPKEKIAALGPDNTIMASTLPIFNIKYPEPPQIDLQPDPEIIAPEPIKHLTQPSDTSGLEEQKAKKEAYEKALQDLKATNEWEEFEAQRENLRANQFNTFDFDYGFDFDFKFDEALKMAELGLKFNEQKMAEIEVRLAEMSARMQEKMLDPEFEMQLAEKSLQLEETMRQFQEQMKEMDLADIQAVAEKYAREASKYALDAEKMAQDAAKISAESRKYAEKVEAFFNEIKPMLTKDGYLKSSADLESLRIDDGEVWVNGVKLKAKDAAKYIELNLKYFNGEAFKMN